MARKNNEKYCKEIIKKTEKYLAGDWKKKRKSEGCKDVIPSLTGLSLFLGVTRDTVMSWQRDPRKPEFTKLAREIKALQRNILLQQGLNGEFNSAIARLVLGKHGYHPQQEIRQETSGTLSLNIVRKVIEIPHDVIDSGEDADVMDELDYDG